MQFPRYNIRDMVTSQHRLVTQKLGITRLVTVIGASMDIVPFLRGVQDGGWKRIEAIDWVYQSWAYDQHNVAATRGFNGDYARALGSIKAKTLIMAGSATC